MKKWHYLSLTVLLLFVVLSVYAQIQPQNALINVLNMGARGDGIADDTDSFIKAIEVAREKKTPVFIPRGEYRISRTIPVEQMSITGPPAGAWPADIDCLPSIIPTHRDGPLFLLGAGGSVCGIDITYEWASEPTTGPAAVVIAGIGAMVRDMRIRYAWDGIIADGIHNIGRTNLENIFMVTIKNVGVRMTGTWDVPRLHNIEVWNAGALSANRSFNEGTGFHLGKNDLIRMTDCFVFGMHYGFLLESKITGCAIQGETWGVMNGCATDFCEYGIVIKGNHILSVSGGSFWNHQSSLVLENGASRVRISGSELISNGEPTIVVHDNDHVVISGCSILRPMEKYTSPAVFLAGGSTVLGLNRIESFGNGIYIESTVRSALIQGNMIESHGKEKIINRASADSEIMIQNNQ